MPESKQKVPQALKELWFVTLGALSLSAEEVRKTIEQFVRRGSISRTDARKLIAQVTQRVNKNRSALEKKVNANISQIVSQLKLPTRGELQGIVRKVTDLAKRAGGDSRPKPARRRR